MSDYSDIYNWYGGKIPPYGTPEFHTFITSSMSFVRYISGDQLNPITVVLDRHSSTAKTTQDHYLTRTMILPVWPLFPETWTEIIPYGESVAREDYSAASVGIFTGFVIHEARHMGVSPSTPVKAFELAGLTDYFKSVKNKRALMDIYQNVEDLYVDHTNYLQPYGIFVDLLNRILFTEEHYNEIMSSFIAETTTANGVYLCMAYKNPDFRCHEGFAMFPEITALLEAALTEHSTAGRVKIACDIYKLLLETDDDSDDDDSDEDDDDSDSGYDGDSRWDEEREMSSRTTEALYDLRRADKLIEALERAMEIRAGGDVFELKDIPPVLTFDVMRAPSYCFDGGSGSTISPAEEWVTFGRQLKLIRSKNYTPGPATEHGHRIVNTRLTRIVTDAKVFGDPLENKNKDQREVSLLVDLSGSMHHMIKDVLQASMGIFMGLRDSHIPCTVYGHTSSAAKTRHHQPLLFTIAQPLSTNLSQRFSRASALENKENLDGLIIERVAKTFSATPVQKVLIVLSDGEPASPNYRGVPAVTHTQHAIEMLRKRGILVYAVSLVESVYRDNDKIYGPQWNIRGGNPELLKSEIKKLIVKISAVKK